MKGQIVKQFRASNGRAIARCCVVASLPLAVAMVATAPVAGAVPMKAADVNTVNPAWPTSLVLASVGAENSTSLMASLAPIQDVFKKQLDLSLTVYTGTSYATVIEAQESGHAQIVEYGPFSYVIAYYFQHLKIENVGILLSAPNTNGGYYSYGVVDPKRTPTFTSIKQATGQKVCFSDPSSTSGYLYPSYGLLKAGINPTTGVKAVFAGTDSTTALDVYNGSCELGFTNNFNLPQVFSQNHVPKADLKIVWTSPEIPGNPVAIDDNLPASFRAAFEKVLDDDANSNYMAAHGYCKSVADCTNITGGWGFGPPSLASFSAVLQVCNLTKAPTCKLS
jgi:phosphonate transport system substrate-binding protein